MTPLSADDVLHRRHHRRRPLRGRHRRLHYRSSPSTTRRGALRRRVRSRATPRRRHSTSVKSTQASFTIQHMPGDNSCLFHSLARGLKYACGVSITAAALRLRIAKHLQNHAAETSRIAIANEFNLSVRNYAQRLKRDTFWGGAIEIIECATLFGVRIGCHTNRPQQHPLYFCPTTVTHSTKIHILYTGNNHYDALIPNDSPE
jgi:hypothetical protein